MYLASNEVKIYFTEPIPMPVVMDADPVIHKRWSGVMNKFAVWRMTEYSQVALLDTDMVFDVDAESGISSDSSFGCLRPWKDLH